MPFQSLFDILLGFFAAFYSLSLLGLTVGILRLRPPGYRRKPKVSVIVAARNEEIHLNGLLESLVHQDYPSFEIVIVNDRSTDGSASILASYRQHFPQIQVIEITAPGTHLPSKKNALSLGIAASKGEILLFTDADCLAPPAWISTIVSGFEDEVGLVAGYSPYDLEPDDVRPATLFSSLLRSFVKYEEFKGAIWSAGSIGLNLGWLCTGRSLAYRRVVFDEVDGFEKIKHSVSGDDDLFLQLVRRETQWKIGYVTHPESHVPTYPPHTFRDFLAQRVRHFSAGKYFSAPMKTFFFLFHLSSLFILLSFLAAIASLTSLSYAWPYVVKCICDSILFFVAAPKFRETRFAPTFLLMELLIVLYNILIGPLGFIRKFEWKPEVHS
jgi:cellulose synthase/poly-beta-1,6-N-acetylglucosamine synthase-like glycosyltransferase